MRFAIYLLLSIALTTATASAQVSTGTPPFSSIGGGPFDQINLGNLNVHFAIPVLHKAGRGRAFNYDLVYDGSFWSPVTSNGTTQWRPGAGWGWTSNIASIMGSLQLSNTLTQGTLKYCNGAQQTITTTYAYYDWKGQSHPFPGSTYYTYTWGGFCTQGYTYSPNLNTHATDGSGYTLTGQSNPNLLSTVTTYAGQIVGFANGLNGSPFQDSNGNYISYNRSAQEFFDTLSSSTPALTIAGTGTPSSPTTYTYAAPGGSAKYTVNYTQYTVATHFSIAGVTDYGPTSAPLVSSVALPDGTQFTFSYEATPGSCTPLANTYASNCVTGRIEEMTLPTGGSITYNYSGGPSNTGIFSDGSTAGISRVLDPGGTWQYARSLQSGAAGPGSTWLTTITDPQGNQTALDFSEDSTTNGTNIVATYSMYETQRQVYQGSQSSGSLLETLIHCYNGNYFGCPSATVHSPISQTDAYTQLPNGTTRLSEIAYNGSFTGSGLVSSDSEYDFGVSQGIAPGTTHLIRQTQTSYASLSNGLIGYPSSVAVYDYSSGSAVLLSSISYSYDQGSVTPTTGTPQQASVTGSRGNLTTVTYQTNSGGSTLLRSNTYYDTGNSNAAMDVNGATFTFTYGACGNSFATSIAEPLNLSRSMTWNCAGGVETAVTDENSKTVTINYTDPDFWRPANVLDQESNETSIAYSGQTASESTLSFNSGQSVVDLRSTADGFGRPMLSQRLQGPGAGSYDTAETDYNNVGLPSRSTMLFSGSEGGTNSTAPGINTTYDALGRPLSVTDADGGATSFTYTNNVVLVTVTGAQSFKKQLQYDGLGRLTSVCEISTTLPGVGTCSQTPAQTGYWIKYTYDALGHLLIVTQNAQAGSNHQTRSYQYDMVGRLTSESNPETSNTGSNGTNTYTYDAACTTTSASPGDLTRKVDSAGNNTCYGYDKLHRLNAAGWNGVCRFFAYDAPGTLPSGVNVANTNTRTLEAFTTNCGSTQYSDEWFSYSPRGELTDVYEKTWHSGSSYYHTSAAYWASGALATLSGIPSVPTLNYGAGGGGLDSEGRYTQVTAGSGTNPVTNVAYSTTSLTNPLGALLGVTYGSTDSDSFTYDPNTGRQSTYAFSVNGNTDVGTTTWNTNGTLASLAINDLITGTSDSQNCSYTYDDLARASSVSCGTMGSQSFSNDPFGNISKTANGLGLSFQPTSYNPNNQPIVNGMSFDSAGNTKTDNLSNSYNWDPNWGTMSSVNGIVAVYDAFGRLVELDNGSSYSEIVYSPVGKMALMNGSILTKAFVPLPGGGTAVYGPAGILYYRHADWLGSSRLASTPSRGLYSSTAYAPFGEQYATAGTADPTFTGQDSDAISSLYDFWMRSQSPSQGRWISPDPSGLGAVDPTNPQSFNRYSYVTNNPLSLIDPTGMNVKGPGCGVGCPGGSDPTFSFAPGGDGSVWSSATSGSLIYTWVPQTGLQYIGNDENGNPVYTITTGYWSLTGQTYGEDAWITYTGPFGSSGTAAPAPSTPNNVSSNSVFSSTFLKSWWTDVKNCIANVGLPAMAADLNPGSDLAYSGGAFALSAGYYNAALVHAASRGLTTPLRSSIYRGLMKQSAGAAEAAPWAILDQTLLAGVIAEAKGCL